MLAQRVRIFVLTTFVIVATVAVWGVGLGVLDRVYAPPAPHYAESPTARVERRPVLFAVRDSGRSGREADAASAAGTAVPIAAVDPGGALRPALGATGADAPAFAAAYFSQGAPLRVLSGGAFAGTLRFEGPADAAGALPVARVGYGPGGPTGLLEAAPDDVLGISDPRFGSETSGARPMRAAHRSAAEQLTHAALRARYPGWQVESAGLARVRVADLDRAGAPELLASVTVHLRRDARRATVALFMIGEPAAAGPAESFDLAFVASREVVGPSDGFAFLDQADLTPAAYDEVVVRDDEGDSARYVVLERGAEGWREAVASPAVRVR